MFIRITRNPSGGMNLSTRLKATMPKIEKWNKGSQSDMVALWSFRDDFKIMEEPKAEVKELTKNKVTRINISRKKLIS